MKCDELADLLPFYAAGALDAERHRAVADHVAGCAACRAELALWTDVGAAVLATDEALPAPSPAVLSGALRLARQTDPGLLARAWQLLVAQVPLVRRELWTSSALVLIIGWVAAVVVGADRGPAFVELLAPLVAVSGVAMIYGPENDPALELALATPTSPRQVLLARLVLVFGYDLALALAATLGLAAVMPTGPLQAIILGWLGPMTFLSSLALVLSLRIGASGAAAIVSALWLSRCLVRGGIVVIRLAPGWIEMDALAGAYEGLWANPAALFALALALVAVGLWLVSRQEHYLPRGGEIG